MVLAVVAVLNAATKTDILCIQFWEHCGDHKHREFHFVRMLFLRQKEIETVFVPLMKLPYVIGPRRDGDQPAFWADATKAKGSFGLGSNARGITYGCGLLVEYSLLLRF